MNYNLILLFSNLQSLMHKTLSIKLLPQIYRKLHIQNIVIYLLFTDLLEINNIPKFYLKPIIITSLKTFLNSLENTPNVPNLTSPSVPFPAQLPATVVDGQWSQWSAWGECSVTCGTSGQRSRTRACDSPRQTHGGRACAESSVQFGNCGKPCKGLNHLS